MWQVAGKCVGLVEEAIFLKNKNQTDTCHSFLGLPKSIAMEPLWQQIKKGSAFTVTCTVDTEDPNTDVSWTRNGVKLTEGNNIVFVI